MQPVITIHITRLSGLFMLLASALDSLTNTKNAWRFKEYLNEIAGYVIANGCPVSIETLFAIETEIAGVRLRNDMAYTDALWMIRQALKGRKREEMVLMTFARRSPSVARTLYRAAWWAFRVKQLPMTHHPALLELAEEVATFVGADAMAAAEDQWTHPFDPPVDPLEARADSLVYNALLSETQIRIFYDNPATLELSIEAVQAEMSSLDKSLWSDHHTLLRITHQELLSHFKSLA